MLGQRRNQLPGQYQLLGGKHRFHLARVIGSDCRKNKHIRLLQHFRRKSGTGRSIYRHLQIIKTDQLHSRIKLQKLLDHLQLAGIPADQYHLRFGEHPYTPLSVLQYLMVCTGRALGYCPACPWNRQGKSKKKASFPVTGRMLRRQGPKLCQSSSQWPFFFSFFFSCFILNLRSSNASRFPLPVIFRSRLCASCSSFIACCALVPTPCEEVSSLALRCSLLGFTRFPDPSPATTGLLNRSL
ncbi:hypothetical protein D3C75_718900 [compost metagenome]